MPEVSVIVPNYNHAPYLKARLNSILKQTYQDFELIILDDYSTDNSKDIIEQYRSAPQVSHIVYNTTNSGNPFTQWKKGMALAQGNLIWIAESDDYSEHTFLEELVSPFRNDSSLVIAFCQSLVLDSALKIQYKTDATTLSEVVTGEEFLEKYMLGVNHIINASMALFKKDAASRVHVPFSEMKYCGDWYFWVNLCLFGKVYISGKYLNYYVRHDKSVAPSAVKKGYDFLEGNKIFHFITEAIQVSNESKIAALKIRSDMYYKRKKSFLNDEVRQECFQSMLALDPAIKGIMEEKVVRARRRKLESKFSWLLSKFLD